MPSAEPSGIPHEPIGPAPVGPDVDAWRERIRRDTFAPYHYHMGAALQRSGDFGPAAEALRRALGIDDTLFQAWLRLRECLTALGDAAQADAVHRQALARDADYEGRARARRALELLDAGDIDAARIAAEDALSRTPALGEAQVARGLVLLFAGAVDEAIAALAAGVTADPALQDRTVEEAVRVGTVARRNERYPEAYAIGRWAADAAPASLDALRLTGQAASYVWRLEECRTLLGHVVGRDPSDARSLGMLGNALELLGLADEATTAFQRMLAGNTNAFMPAQIPLGHCGVGRMLMAKGRLEEGLDHYRAATAEGPGIPWTHAHLALGHLTLGDRTAALAAARQATGLSRSDPWAMAALGTVLVEGGEVARGIGLLRNAVALLPERPWPLLDLAFGLYRGQRTAEAAIAYRRAVLQVSDALALAEAQRPWAGEAFAALRRECAAARAAGRP